MARLAREHNDANVLVLGAHIIGQEVAFDCLKTFLTTKFLEGRFVARRDKLTHIGGL
jgi:ribose 5-phosphate isomerase B